MGGWRQHSRTRWRTELNTVWTKNILRWTKISYIGNSPTSATFRSEFFSGDGSTTTFSLAYSTGNEASVIVSISGVKQKTDSYALINGQIVFTAAPPSGSQNIELTYLGDKAMVTPYLSADTNGIIRINASTLTENCTITTGYNASSAGPLTVANNVVVNVANNSTWTIF